jgi:hypothetical protein
MAVEQNVPLQVQELKGLQRHAWKDFAVSQISIRPLLGPIGTYENH